MTRKDTARAREEDWAKGAVAARLDLGRAAPARWSRARAKRWLAGYDETRGAATADKNQHHQLRVDRDRIIELERELERMKRLGLPVDEKVLDERAHDRRRGAMRERVVDAPGREMP